MLKLFLYFSALITTAISKTAAFPSSIWSSRDHNSMGEGILTNFVHSDAPTPNLKLRVPKGVGKKGLQQYLHDLLQSYAVVEIRSQKNVCIV